MMMEDARVGDFDGDGQPDSDVSDTGAMEGSRAFSGSWTDLMALGGAYTCDIDTTSNTGAGSVQTTGTVYVAGSDLRGDFSSMVGGKMEETHMIRVGQESWVWSTAMPQGIKMMVKDSVKSGDAVGTSGQGFNENTSYEWDCDPWTRDSSKFSPPSNVQFMDMEAMMQGL